MTPVVYTDCTPELCACAIQHYSSACSSSYSGTYAGTCSSTHSGAYTATCKAICSGTHAVLPVVVYIVEQLHSSIFI